LSRLH